MGHQECKILFVTSFPPRECGIATFTRDLVTAIKDLMDSSIVLDICALEDGQEMFKYSRDVKYVLDTRIPKQYKDIAKQINADAHIKVVMIEHEFGLFGGDYGQYLLILLERLVKPVVITFHSVMPKPNKILWQLVRAIVHEVNAIIVMTRASEEILIRDYQIAKKKIKVVPHGTHIVVSKSKQLLKERFKVKDRLVLSTFGLLGRNKSIETVLDALPDVISHFPDVLYFVLGKTHPNVLKQEGESYREFLKAKVRKLGISHNVRFVNHFLNNDELFDYLRMSDIYVFSSNDPNQAVSGTFVYAMSCACPIVSTPIPQALELLSEDTGVIVDFADSKQFAASIIRLLASPHVMQTMANNALYKTRSTFWGNVAHQVMNNFKPFIHINNFRYRLPPVKLRHVQHLTTKRGIIQFSKFDIVDINSGYTLDDNARALIAMIMHYELTARKDDLDLINIYLEFILSCQQEDGAFINYVDHDGTVNARNKVENLEDANGRAVWALGYFVSRGIFSRTMVKKAEICLLKRLKSIEDVAYPRAMAFIIKGLHYYAESREDVVAEKLINLFAQKLVNCYNASSDKKWRWFESKLTYSNMVLPEAMLMAWRATKNYAYQRIALNSFNFLIDIMYQESWIKVISNKGWFHKNDRERNMFGEQPVDVCSTIMTLHQFYLETQKSALLEKMDVAFDWFLGHNHLHQTIYNPVTGGCYDGLEKHRVNLNQGAESTVSYLLARLTMEKVYPGKLRTASKKYSRPAQRTD